MKLALVKDGIVKAIVSSDSKEAYLSKVTVVEDGPEVVEVPEGTEVSVLDTYAEGTFTATGEAQKIAEARKSKDYVKNKKSEPITKEEEPKRTAEDFGK
jgi:hypothetical protein